MNETFIQVHEKFASNPICSMFDIVRDQSMISGHKNYTWMEFQVRQSKTKQTLFFPNKL